MEKMAFGILLSKLKILITEAWRFFEYATYLIIGLIKSLVNTISSIEPDASFLSDVAAFEAVLIGVSIPISLQVVTWTAERFRDIEISKIFIGEKLYKAQYVLFISNILIAIFFKFAKINDKFALWVLLFWLFLNVYIFLKFIKRVEQYAANTENYLLKRLKKNVEDILQE